jgi:hypothetical protein
MPICSDLAWNNLVMRDHPAKYGRGEINRAAAVAAMFMAFANNGGLMSFLTSTPDLDATEVVDALATVGATHAAGQLASVLNALGTSLPISSEEDRWTRLDSTWTDDLNDHDVLAAEADEQLLEVLRHHVAANEAYYTKLE